MDLFSSSSDMDLSLNYCSQHQEYANDYKIFVLKKLRRALEQRSSGRFSAGACPATVQ